jgi:hypothetical protein
LGLEGWLLPYGEKIMKLNYLFLLMMLAAGACVTAPVKTVGEGRRPSWMDNPHRKYPLKYYIAAVGEGDSLSDAQSVAAGNLAKIFKTDIDVEERLEERYFELIGDKNSYQEKTKFNRNVRINSSMSLVNIQYAESYKDETGRIYALAFINRAKTAAIYKTRLAENNKRTVAFVDLAGSSVPSVRYAAISAAEAVSRGSQLMLEQLDVLSPSIKKSVVMSYKHDDLARRLAEAAAMVHFSIDITNDEDGKTKGALESLITEMGFVIDSKGEFSIKGSLTFEDTDLKRGDLAFIRYKVKLDLIDIGGQTVVSISKQGREGHISKKEARARCVRTIESLIDHNFRIKMQKYFDELVTR